MENIQPSPTCTGLFGEPEKCKVECFLYSLLGNQRSGPQPYGQGSLYDENGNLDEVRIFGMLAECRKNGCPNESAICEWLGI